MFQLSDADIVGKGYHRTCYLHPSDNSLCIKIMKSTQLKELDRELRYYELLTKKNISWDLLSRYRGDVETNQGLGQVFDLITDRSGKPSKTFEHYFKSPQDESTENLLASLKELKSYMLENAIVTTTLKPRNIVYQKGEKGNRAVIIDDIGNTEFIPLSNVSNAFARAKIKRKWKKFETQYLKP